MRCVLLLSGLAGGLTACAESLPDVRMIEGTRPLAVRVEVTASLLVEEPPDAAVRCQALPFDTVTLTPFVVDPEGPVDPEAVDPVWIACQLNPGQGLFGCISAAFPIALADIPACEVPDPMDLQMGEIPAAQSPCVIARTGTPSLQVPINSSVLVGGDIEVTMIGQTPGGTSTDECAESLLSGDHEVPDDCILAVQRLELGPLDALLLLAEELGIDLGDIDLPDPDEVPDFDRNPRISGLEVSIVDSDGQAGEPVDVAPGDVLEAAVGDTLRVRTTVPEEDLQLFLQPINQTETEEEVETIEGDFFRSWGRLLSGSIDDTDAYDEWTLVRDQFDDPNRPEGDVATLFFTLRDNRTGVDWSWFHVDVSE